VLVAGGGTAGDSQRTNSAELYDPVQGRFMPTGSTQTPRSYGTAVRLKDGRVLLAGGMSHGDFPNPEIEASAEIYNPTTGRFTAAGSMSASRWKQGMALLRDGKVLVVGGQTGGSNDNRLSSTEVYDPGTGRFTRGPEMHLKRFKLHDGVVSLRDGRILVAGGADQMELYDPAAGSFSTVGGVALDGFFFATATLLGDGKVLVVNGYGHRPLDGAVRHAWLYEP
jgi:Kelch motif